MPATDWTFPGKHHFHQSFLLLNSMSFSLPFYFPHYNCCLCETSKLRPCLSSLLKFAEIGIFPCFVAIVCLIATYIYIYAYVDIHIYEHTYIHIYLHIRTIADYIYMYVCLYMCVCGHIYVTISQQLFGTYFVLCIVLGLPQTLILFIFSVTP